jgi:hypothetical protein
VIALKLVLGFDSGIFVMVEMGIEGSFRWNAVGSLV